MLLLLLTLVGANGVRDAFPKRISEALDHCCARTDGCDALDCRLYREFRDSYRYEALEAQCSEPLLYAFWPPHRARSVRFNCLAPDHFLARLQHMLCNEAIRIEGGNVDGPDCPQFGMSLQIDPSGRMDDIRTSEAQATLDAREVQFLCIVDPRAIAHPQYRDMERVLANGSRVVEPYATTYIRGADADLLWRYLHAAAAPAAFSEIHVRAPRRYSGVRAPCADGSRSLLTLNAAQSVRRLLPELGRRHHSKLRVLAHVYGVDSRAHCVLCEYRDGAPRVKMKKFETSVSAYPYHRRVTEPQRRAPPWARRDRLRARDSLWCAGYRALLALHRPQIMLEGGVRYRPRRARRCHVLALGGARVIKLLLGDAAQLARVRLPAYAMHVQLRWAAAPSRWKPESVSVVRVGAALGTRRRLSRARWLPRRRAYYARALTLRAPDGHYLTIDTLGVEYFENGTPERFSRSIDGKLDNDEDLTEVDWTEVDLATPEQQHPYRMKEGNYNAPITPTRTTLSRTAKVGKSILTADIGKSRTFETNLDKFCMSTAVKKNKSPAKTTDLNKTSLFTKEIEKSTTATKMANTNLFATVKKEITAAKTTDVNKPSVDLTNMDKSKKNDKSRMKTKNSAQLMHLYKMNEQTISPEITRNVDTSSTQTKDANELIKIMLSVTTCVQVTHTMKTMVPVFSKSLARLYGYLNMSNVNLSQSKSRNSKSDKPNKTPWKIILIVAGIVLVVVLAGVCTVCLARYGMCPHCGQKRSKELQEAAPAAAAGTTRAEGAEGGPLDMVVQSLIVAQGVTIALAARMLWHLWHTNHGVATGVATGAGSKVP